MAAVEQTRVVVTDANVLINLIHVGRIDLLGSLSGYEFVVPPAVEAEVSIPEQAKAEGASRASAVAKTKADTVDRARDLAKTQPLGQVVIHKSNGQIQTEHTHGDDPHPPKG